MLFDNYLLQKYLRESPDLTSIEKLVALVLSTYRNSQNGDCFPNQIRLAVDCGLTRQHVNLVVKSLKKKNVVSINREKRKFSRRVVRNYVFSFDKTG
jgi:hypothetical protein